MTDLEYRCVHGHDKCAEMYPGPECPYCERIHAAPFVKMGLVVEALWADAVDRPKFYSSMGLNFEKIIGDALAAARREGAEAERAEWMSCALVDAMMEGPALKGWNRSALDRLWRRGLTPEEPT